MSITKYGAVPAQTSKTASGSPGQLDVPKHKSLKEQLTEKKKDAGK